MFQWTHIALMGLLLIVSALWMRMLPGEEPEPVKCRDGQLPLGRRSGRSPNGEGRGCS